MNYLGKKPLAIIETRCSQFVAPFKKALENAGLWIFQSFDLQSMQIMPEGCTCPNHGTNQCTCELIVLLVYQNFGSPISLILDGRDEKTYVYIADDMQNVNKSSLNRSIELAIQKAFISHLGDDTFVTAE